MAAHFFTNRGENTLMAEFQGLFESNPQIHFFDVVVGFLRASGYFAIRPLMQHIEHTRILVGINIDKYIYEAKKRGELYISQNVEDELKENFLADLRQDIEQAAYQKQVEDGILQFVQDYKEGKIEIRIHPSKRIHAKIYILYPDNYNPHAFGGVITGSSNLSGNGLGLGNEHQYEFNVKLTQYEDVHFAQEEFELLWAEGIDLAKDDIVAALSATYLSEDEKPFDIYIKMLQEYFGKRIDYNFANPYEMPEGIKRMEYQLDAVDEGYHKLIKYDGFFLSDVVGLGKTIIAAMIVKRFCLENGRDNTKVLVVYPPAVEKNWKTTFDRFGITNARFISNGSLDKVLDPNDYNYWNAEEYDLIVVDESHKFRNNETGMFKSLQEICKCPRINQGLIAGKKKKVMLISATPLNNSPEDIYNQILLFQDPRRCTLDGMTNLTSFFAPKIKRYNELKNAQPFDVNSVKQLYEEIREKVIKPLTIRRTRKDIASIPRYQKDVDDFPTVEPPFQTGYELTEEQAKRFVRAMEALTERLQYARYQAISYLHEDIKRKYYERADLTSHSLAQIMRTNMVKRLESSFTAFEISLKRYRDANQNMLDMFAKDKIFIANDLDINKLIEKGLSDEEFEEKVLQAQEKNEKNRTFSAKDFKPEFIDMLQADKLIIEQLCEEWANQTADNDPKLRVFLELLENELFDKKRNTGGRVVIFTESTDTAEYLKRSIGRSDVLQISSKNRNEKFTTIEENFDANCPERKRKEDYKIIITTDVLAEGINLHRANIIVNYDTPWNATRLMQRIGRVNRIGSDNKHIYNYVFYPSLQGNSIINLYRISLTKIQAFHTAFGEDNQIYATEEILDFDLEHLFDAAANEGEELNEELQYLEFIRTFKSEHPKDYQRIERLNIRSRCGRNAIEKDGHNTANSTLVYLRTGDKSSFYLVGDTATELTTLQALHLFETTPDEKPIPRIDQHFEHVEKAKTAYEIEVNKDFQSTQSTRQAGGQVQKAIGFVRGFKVGIDDPHRLRRLDQLIKMIEWGTITRLATEITRLERSLMNHTVTRAEAQARIEHLAQHYETYFRENSREVEEKETMIILSESFK